jgi:site-specific DNA recombinase
MSSGVMAPAGTAVGAIAPGVQIMQREPPVPAEAFQRKRVAAYCRVSTDLEQQASSLETQMQSFRELIAARPGWELIDIYADQGLTGTNASRRVEFQRMIADCEAGRIDYIITKSISRFARNTIDCLQYVRRLKDIGIFVYFDENHLDTGSGSSEMLLSILAAVAQEESHSISENMKWGIRKRFQAGKPKWVKTYGFIKGEDGEYHINEEQAKGVRRIFELYVSGRSLPEIVRILEMENIPAMKGGKWWPKSLATVLHNEKYIGDVMMQKSYTVDHLSHKKVKNDQTIVPSYYIRDHHEAVVDRKTFELAQTILSLKDRHKGCTQYPYHGFLVCPFCGDKMVRFHLPVNGHPGVWACGGAKEEVTCPPYVLHEKYIDRIVRDAYERLDQDELIQLAAKRSEKGEAAKGALEWLNKQPRLKRIEYVFLDALVERIAFNRWSEAVVSWKFGQKSRVPVCYDKTSEIPNVELADTENGYMLGGERVDCGQQVMLRINRTKASCEKARIRNEHGRPRDIKKDTES